MDCNLEISLFLSPLGQAVQMAVAALNIQRSDIQIYASVTDCGCQIKYV